MTHLRALLDHLAALLCCDRTIMRISRVAHWPMEGET